MASAVSRLRVDYLRGSTYSPLKIRVGVCGKLPTGSGLALGVDKARFGIEYAIECLRKSDCTCARVGSSTVRKRSESGSKRFSRPTWLILSSGVTSSSSRKGGSVGVLITFFLSNLRRRRSLGFADSSGARTGLTGAEKGGCLVSLRPRSSLLV